MTARGLGLALALALAACGRAPVRGAGSDGPRTDPMPEDAADFGPLPDFRLVSERGRTVTLESLRGHPLVIGALFTTCTGPCPSIARALATLQVELAGTDVHIVVVSVDPATDTPEALERYGQRMGADPERWTFLTGPEADVQALVREGLFMPLDRDPVEGLTHDTRLLAVDRDGHRRGWYQGTDEVQVEKLRRRLLFLASEDAGTR